MKLTVQPVGINYIHQTWPFVKKYIDDSFAKGHDFPEEALSYKPEHVLQSLTSGQWLLVVAVDEEFKIHGACTVSFINYPLHRVAFVTTYGGQFITNKEVMDQFKNILKAHGATKVQALCRKAMVRLLSPFGFEPRNVLVETPL